MFVEMIVFSKSMGSLLSKWPPNDVSWVWLISLCLLQLSSVSCNTACIVLQPTCSVWIERLMTSWQCKSMWVGNRALCWSLGAHNKVELGISMTLGPPLWSRSSAGTDWSKGRNDSALDPLILVQLPVCHRNWCRPELQITVSALSQVQSSHQCVICQGIRKQLLRTLEAEVSAAVGPFRI